MDDLEILPSIFLSLCTDLGVEEEKLHIISRIELWADPILSWIPSKIPNFTDHGKLHSDNVLKNIIILLEEYPSCFSDEEKLLLALASKIHDVGCIIDRDNHHKHTIKLMNDYIIEYLNKEIGHGLVNCLKQIMVSHSKKYDLNHIIRYEHDEVNLGLMCSIFRLADALDQTNARISKTLFDILLKEKMLDPQSEEIWRAHLSIKNIKIEKTRITIFIEDFVYSDIILRSLDEELKLINKYLEKKDHPLFDLIIRAEEIAHPLEDEALEEEPSEVDE